MIIRLRAQGMPTPIAGEVAVRAFHVLQVAIVASCALQWVGPIVNLVVWLVYIDVSCSQDCFYHAHATATSLIPVAWAVLMPLIVPL